MAGAVVRSRLEANVPAICPARNRYGAAIGPPLGGWITDSFPWRWVFLHQYTHRNHSMVLTSRSFPILRIQEGSRRGPAGGKLRSITWNSPCRVGFACLEWSWTVDSRTTAGYGSIAASLAIELPRSWRQSFGSLHTDDP